MHYPLQGSSHQVWSAQVHSSLGTRLVQEAQYSYRVWGHAPQEWNLETMRLRLRPFWAHTMLLRGQMTEFHMYEYLYPFCPLRLTVLVSAFQSSA